MILYINIYRAWVCEWVGAMSVCVAGRILVVEQSMFKTNKNPNDCLCCCFSWWLIVTAMQIRMVVGGDR